MMGRLVAVSLCIVFMSFSGRSFAAPAFDRVQLSQDFLLRLGQTAMVEGADFTVTFRAILEDSRCPVDVDCIWAGNGKISLDILDAEGDRRSLIINTEVKPRVISLMRYELQLVSLTPVRHDGISILSSEYSVTLRIVEKD